MQRIEAAYTYGGPSASVNTVEKTFNIPIDHYCVFNFNSFIKLIDAIGGIDIDVEKSFMGTDESGIESIKFNSGEQHLDGAKALSYARERHVDTDIMRGFRQQKVISAVEEKLKSMTSFTNLYSIIDSLDDNIQTDITPKDIKELISNALTFSNYSKQQLTFDWRTFSNQGRSMVELYKDSIKFVSHKLRVSLELDRKMRLITMDIPSIQMVTIFIKVTILSRIQKLKHKKILQRMEIHILGQAVIQLLALCLILRLQMVLLSN